RIDRRWGAYESTDRRVRDRRSGVRLERDEISNLEVEQFGGRHVEDDLAAAGVATRHQFERRELFRVEVRDADELRRYPVTSGRGARELNRTRIGDGDIIAALDKTDQRRR